MQMTTDRLRGSRLSDRMTKKASTLEGGVDEGTQLVGLADRRSSAWPQRGAQRRGNPRRHALTLWTRGHAFTRAGEGQWN